MMLAEPSARPSLLPWIAVSTGVHALLAFWLWSATLAPSSEPEPRVIRLTLIHDSVGDGAAAPQPAPVPAPAPARERKAPKRVVAAPKPVPVPASTPAPAPAPEAAPALAAETAPDAAGVPGGSEAGGAVAVASVGSGPPGGTPGGDPLAAYIRRVRDSIARHKRYPVQARRHRIEGRILLRLTIAGDGALVESEAVESPSSVLSRSALAAVAAASPFPPPPDGRLKIEVPIRYSLAE
jgi:protein TonB